MGRKRGGDVHQNTFSPLGSADKLTKSHILSPLLFLLSLHVQVLLDQMSFLQHLFTSISTSSPSSNSSFSKGFNISFSYLDFTLSPIPLHQTYFYISLLMFLSLPQETLSVSGSQREMKRNGSNSACF